MNLQLLRTKTAEDKMLFIYGFLGTMPIVEVLGFTAFTWLTLITVGYILIKGKGNLKISKSARFFIILSVSMIVSSLVGIFSDMPSYWKSLGTSNMVWQVLYIIVVLYYMNKKRIHKCLFYIKGVYYAAIIHCVWGLFQLLIYRVTGIAINQVIFHDLLGVELASFVQMRGGSIALTGFCWNAGNLAPLVIIGYLLSGSVYVKLFFLLVTAISGSRTLILGMVACVGIQIAIGIFRRYKGKMKKSYIIAVSGVFLIILIFVLTQRGLMNSIVERIQEVSSSFTLDYLQSQASSRVHARYWTTIPTVTKWNSFIHNLFGYGIGCSGYPFAVLLNQYADHAWTVECDFINNLWGIGYIGFILWYGWYAIHIVRSIKIDKKYLMLFIGLLVEGVTYNVTFNWCYIFLLMTFGLIDEKVNVFAPMSQLAISKWRLNHAVIRNN